MREYRSADGERRLWFDHGEIEGVMEDELHKAGMSPKSDAPVVDVEGFIEFYLGATLDQYADLDTDILGETRFVRGRPPFVFINRGLTEQAEGEVPPSGVLGRWRATLAHEAAHVVLHRSFYELPSTQGSLWDDNSHEAPPLMRCLHRDIVTNRTPSDWREVQANRGMAGLLMPKRSFTELIRRTIGAGRSDDLLSIIHSMKSYAFKEFLIDISAKCAVSQQAARYRMSALGLIRDDNEKFLTNVSG